MSGFTPVITRRHLLRLAGAVVGSSFCPTFASDTIDIAPQPYFSGVNRALETMVKLGSPVAAEDAEQIAILSHRNDRAAIDAAEQILDRYTLTHVAIEANGYARTTEGGAQKTLIEQGWRVFLVRVSNSLGSTDNLREFIGDPSMTTTSRGSGSRAGVPDTVEMAPYIASAWLTGQLYNTLPMLPALSGFAIEYKVIQLYSRDRGRHRMAFNFVTTSDQIAWMAAKYYQRGVSLDFECLQTRDIVLQVRDTNGQGCVASLIIKDKLDRIYPLQAMRLAPDMQFQPHIYRADGETLRLPDGEYTVESKRGPEYLRDKQTVTIGQGRSQIEVQLKRWIDPAKWGWYSGDTHIHAAGCAHYERPTEGISPESMIRHVRGEGLSIGDVLTWGPSWYYQKQFFTGHAESPVAALEHPDLQAANNASLQPRATPEDAESLLRYDVEVSGFPSSHCGHLVLLRLKDQDYPESKVIQDWPSWNLPILKWAKMQGAVAGYAHCGMGMVVDSTDLPNYDIPPMDGVGTQEAIVDVTHGVVDFLSGCDTNPVAELNAWYHMLNCGFRLAMLGETDYPCISGERPGVGRSYVRLDHRPVDDTGYNNWINNLKRGRIYCGDGRSHFLEFKVQGRMSGDEDILFETKNTVNVEATVSARLEPEPTSETEAIRLRTEPMRGMFQLPGFGWHLERARIGRSREVSLELMVNGIAVDRMTMLADGTPRPIQFTTAIARSSWVALRILPSGHTYPVFVQVGNKPIRASKRSAQWCRTCVDKLWEVKSPFIRESERPGAAEAFNYARKVYDTIASECQVE
jgi:hypothetical protein